MKGNMSKKEITMTSDHLYFFMNYIRLYAEAQYSGNELESFFYATKISNFLKKRINITKDEELDLLYTELNSRRKLIINQFELLMEDIIEKFNISGNKSQMIQVPPDNKHLIDNLEEFDNSDNNLILSAKMNTHPNN